MTRVVIAVSVSMWVSMREGFILRDALNYRARGTIGQDRSSVKAIKDLASVDSADTSI